MNKILGNALVSLVLMTSFLSPALAVQNVPLYTLPKLRRTPAQKPFKVSYPDKYPFPLVSIQFPADKSETFVDDIANFKMLKKEKKELVTQLVDEQVLKSTYLACQLYEYLKNYLPEKSIILVPTNLQTDGNGKVINFPVNKPIPAVVQVDLFSQINLLRFKKPEQTLWQPDTFADKALTALTMSAPIDGSRATFAICKPTHNIESFYNNYLGRQKSNNEKPTRKVRVTTLKQDFRFEPKDVESDAKDTPKATETAGKEQLRYYGNLIVEQLNKQDLEKIKPILMSEYIDDIAPDLAKSLAAGTTPDADLQRKEKFFNYCLSAMREQLFVKESDTLADIIYDGEFGKQFRTAINAEYQYEKKSMASQRRQALAIALCGATAGVGLVAMAAAAPIAAFHMAMAGAAMTVAGHEASLQGKLRTDFQKTWNDSHAAQVSCMLTLDNDTIEVRGDGAEGFRKSMKEAYEKRFCTTATATTTGAM